MQKGDILDLEIVSSGMEGEGVARVDGMVVFVPLCMQGEKVRVMVREVNKKFARATVIKVLEPCADRIYPLCPIFYRCGCCDMQHIRYEKQLEIKKANVEACLYKSLGRKVVVDDVRGDGIIFGYRNKIHVPLAKVAGKVVAGYYKGNTHDVVPFGERVREDLGACVMYERGMQDMLDAFLSYANDIGLDCYDERKKTGFLRHFVARKVGNKYAVVVVGNGKKLPVEKKLITALTNTGREFSLYFDSNTKNTNVIMSPDIRVVFGEERLEADVLGVRAKVSPLSFMQINDGVRDMIYDRVASMIKDGGEKVVIDAYSGAGVLTNVLAKSADKVYGIEIVKEAVADADELTEDCGNTYKVKNICGDCAEELPPLAEKLREEGIKFSVVLDPPRKGCDEKVLDAIKSAKPDNVYYISCNPATLARDLARLDTDYEILSVSPYDMFPETKHVETLVVLSHKKPDSHIEVKINFDNTSLDKSAIAKRAEKRKPKDKPTYKDIQDWVEKNYGFKVHTAYIAEVKRNEGLPMYDAPNAVEELKRPRSHPTDEMKEAIKDALKHFEII